MSDAEPIFSDALERFYYRLPDVFRDEDENYDYVFKKWLAGILGELQVVDTYYDRFYFATPDEGVLNGTSDLVDPNTADKAWLPWLAQFVGVKLNTRQPLAFQRDQIAQAITGIKPGSKDAVARAAKPTLANTQYTKVFDHSSTLADIGTKSQWDVLIVTRASETLENRMPLVQSTMRSSGVWGSTNYRLNLVGASTWTTGTATAGSGTTNPLRGSSYNTYTTGTAYVSGTASEGVTYEGVLFIRNAGATGTLSLVYLDASNATLGQTDLAIAATATWQRCVVSGTSPTGTRNIRLMVTATSGTVHVSLPYVGLNTGAIFDQNSLGVTVEGNAVKMPEVNYAINPSYDAAGGWTSNGTITLDKSRFWTNNSSAKVVIGASACTVSQPAIETFEGGTVQTSTYLLSGQESGTAFYTFTYTYADGTTSSVSGPNVDISEDIFTEMSWSAVTPANAKSVSVVIGLNGGTGDFFNIDGWMISRGTDVLPYGDGSFQGWTWTTPSDHTTSRSYGSIGTTAFITSDDNVYNSNVIDVVAEVNGVVRFDETPTAGYMVISQDDPFTFMISAWSVQDGSYPAVFQVRFTDDGGTSIGITELPITLTTDIQQFTIATTSPHGSTRATLRVLVMDVLRGQHFRFAMAGGRLGSVTTWVPQSADPVGTVIAAGEKPAGILLHNAAFEAQWQTIEADRPTWYDNGNTDAWEPFPWQKIEETGLAD